MGSKHDGTASRPVLLAYCKVAFGVGHWVRMATLLEALTTRFGVVLLLDGELGDDLEMPEGIEIVALADAARDRRQQLVAAVQRVAPAVILLEYFPFGRHECLIELQRMLHESRTRLAGPPLILSSLRDIGQQARAAQAQFDARACDLCNRYFDAVLVHSDPQIADFAASFSRADELTTPVIHTGYVAPEDDFEATPRRDRTVLVSAGGGLGGEGLLRAVLNAVAATDLGSRYQFRMIAGTFQPDGVWRKLERKVATLSNVTLLRWVPNLRRELAQAAVSVSRFGYNTALDLLRTRTPALVVPFATGEEDEQTARARDFERRGAVRVLLEDQATPDRLALEIRRTEGFEPRAMDLNMNGARRSAEIIESMLVEKKPRSANG